MHRSGTSALAGVFNLCGYSIGNNFLEETNDNIKGFYENKQIMELNDRFLYALNSNWQTTLPLKKIKKTLNKKINIRACEIIITNLIEESNGYNHLIKDPRLSLLLPIWLKAFENLNIKPKIIISVRKPLDVSHSLKERNNISINKSLLLWEYYNLYAEKHSKNYKRVFSDYDLLLQNPKEHLKMLYSALKLEDKDKIYKHLEKINHFIEPDLNHYTNKVNSQKNKALSKPYDELYKKLLDLNSKKEIDTETKKYFDSKLDAINKTSSIYYENILLHNNNKYKIIYKNGEQNLKTISKFVKLGNNKITIPLEQNRKFNWIRFKPVSEISYIKLNSILCYNETSRAYLEPSSIIGTLEFGDKYIFYKNDYLDFNLENEDFNKIEIDLDILLVGISTLNIIPKIHQNIKKWFYSKLSEKEEIINNNEIKHIGSINEYKKEEVNYLIKLDTYLSKIDALEGHLQLLNEQYQTSDAHAMTLESLNKKLNKEITIKEERLIANKSKIENLTNELSLTEFELTNSRHILDNNESLTKELKTFKQSNKILEEKNMLLKDERSKLSSKLKANNKLIKTLESKIDQQSSSITKAISKQHTALNDVKSLLSKNKQLGSEIKLVKNNEEKYLEIIQLLKKEANEKDTIISELNKQIEHKDQLIINQEKKYVTSEEYKNEVLQKLNKTISQQDKNLNNLVTQIANFQVVQSSLEKNNINKETQVAELLKNNNTLNKNHNSLVSQFSQLENELKLKEVELESSKTLLKKTEQVIDSINESKLNSEILIREKVNQVEILNYEINQLTNIIKDQIEYIYSVRKSLSYRLGFGVTKPFRFFYNKATGIKLLKDPTSIVLLSLVNLGIKNPHKVIKSISKENFDKLKQALKTEDPRLITENIKSYINKEEVELMLNTASSKALKTSNHEPAIVDTQLDKDNSRFKVLFICPNLPDYDSSAGGKRAFNQLKLLSKKFDVYVFTKGSREQKYITVLEENGINVLLHRDPRKIKKRIPNFYCVIFAWYSTYYSSKEFLTLYPSSKIIFDTVDIHWVREERSIGNWEGVDKQKIKLNKEKELEAYRYADIIWTVTQPDKDAVLKELPQADVRIVSVIEEPIKTEYKDSGTNNILFLGGYRHYPNLSAAKRLALEILPKINEEIPDAKLILAGSHAPDEIKDLAKNNSNIVFKGFVADEDIEQLYSNTQIIICPLLAGAGIKGKICEAISYMVPVITNDIGNEGINLIHMEEGYISDDNLEIAQLAIKALQRTYQDALITSNAQKKLFRLVSPDAAYKSMLNSIIPEVCICIVTYNQLKHLEDCISSIYGNTNYPRYRIIVHSNGCTDGSQEFLQAAQKTNNNLEIILSKENDVFVKPNNWMMEANPDSDIVLLNNDVTVTENWLTNLVKTAYDYENVGIVGSKVLYPDGKLQEFGGILYDDGTGANIGKYQNPDEDQYKITKRASFVSGCSMFIKRSTIERIGVFDEQFHPCYCEDADMCYTAWENDIETLVTHDSIVFHHEGATAGTDTSSGFKKYQDINFKKFIKKHNTKINEVNNKVELLNNLNIII